LIFSITGAAFLVFDFASAVGAATCIAAFDVLENEPERHAETVGEHTLLEKELGLLGFDIGGRATPASETPITRSSSARAS